MEECERERNMWRYVDRRCRNELVCPFFHLSVHSIRFIRSFVHLFVCSFVLLRKIAVYKRAVRQQSYNRPLSSPSKSIESIASSPDNANGSANRLPTREPTSELESQLADQTKQTENSSNELRTVRIGRAGSSNNANGNRWKIIGQFLLIIHPNID